ncbi:MAG: hypothetical protein ABIS07_07420, partial [Dokdonella sp.]
RSSPIVVPVESIHESSLRKRERANAAQDAAATAAPAAEMEPPAAPASAPAKPILARKPAPKPAPATDAVKEISPPPLPAAAAPPMAQAIPFPAEANRAESTAAPASAAGAVAPKDDERKAKQASGGDVLDDAASNRTRFNAPSAPSGSVELRRDMQLAPDAWLAHIKQLLHQGRRQQAADSLRLFRRMHPELPVSAELRALEN